MDMDNNDMDRHPGENGDTPELMDFTQKEERKSSTLSRRADKAARERGREKRRKQQRNIFIAGVLTGILLSSIISLLIPDKEKEPEVPKEPVVETPVVEEPEEVLPEPEALMEDRNHANMAEEYAYDIEEVNGWLADGREGEDKTVFLTFDDGPGAYTEEILDILKEKEVPATFFTLGTNVEKYSPSSSIWNRFLEEGHGIAIHSYSHDYEVLYPGRTPDVEKIMEEWNKTKDLLKERMGEDFNTRVFRFPGGSMSWKDIAAAKEELVKEDIYSIDWNALTGDSDPVTKRPQSEEEVYEKIEDNLSRFAHPETVVLLMHDTKEDAAKYLGFVIDKLKEDGYDFGILR